MAGTGDDVGLLLDTGHLVFAGGDPVSVARRHARASCTSIARTSRRDVLRRRAAPRPQLSRRGARRHLHCAGRRLDRLRGRAATICADAGYAGWLVVEAEQDPAKAHPLTYARLGFDNLKRAAEDAGFAVAPPQLRLRDRFTGAAA